MSYIKCNACPSHADCEEAGKCLNTLVTHSYGRHVPIVPAAGAPVPNVPAPAPAAPKAARQPRQEGQGARPAAGTTTGRVWAIADELLQATPAGPSKEFRRSVITACEAAGINSSTASVQYGKWLSSRS